MLTIKRRSFWLGIVLSLVIYGVIQVLLSSRVLNDVAESTLILIGINIILGVSLNLINGITGQFSIGHAGFMAVGAYMSAIMTLDFDMPFLIAMLLGGCLAAIFGLLIGIPTLRLKGIT